MNAVATDRFVCSWCYQFAFGEPVKRPRVLAGKQITLTLCANCAPPCRIDGCCGAASQHGLCERCWEEGLR